MYDCGSEWWLTVVGILSGIFGAGGVGALGWWLNRRRLRKSIARVLFVEAKRVRHDWVDAIEQNRSIGPRESYLTAWRSSQDRAVDLLPDEVIRRLIDIQWTIDRVTSQDHRLTPEGAKDIWAVTARAERDLAEIAGEQFDPSTAVKLGEVEAEGYRKP